jgi:hypothetical protein
MDAFLSSNFDIIQLFNNTTSTGSLLLLLYSFLTNDQAVNYHCNLNTNFNSMCPVASFHMGRVHTVASSIELDTEIVEILHIAGKVIYIDYFSYTFLENWRKFVCISHF